METPAVSIIMPAYNAGATIAESIQSVLNQVYQYWELIVVDDGSKDNTSEIVNTFINKEKRVILLRLLQNGGLPNARNEGCKMARGKFIAFLDSDDLWHVDKLAMQLHFHSVHPDIEISHTDFHLFNDQGFLKRPLKYFIDLKRHKQGQIYPRICYRNPIGILTVMAKKTLLQEVGFFDASLWTMEDQDLWVRIAKRKIEFGYISRVLGYYRITPGGISRKTGKYKKAYKKFIQKVLGSENINHNMIWRNYYRTLGTTYFRNGHMELARLYFWRSIKLVPFDRIAITTYLYMIYGLVKELLKRFEFRKGRQS